MHTILSVAAALALLATATPAQAEAAARLRGVVETSAGEKLEGWLRFDGASLFVTEIEGGKVREIRAAELRVAHMHLVDAVPSPQSRVAGLRGSYFPAPDFGGGVVVRVDPQIDFVWDNGSPLPVFPSDDFSVRWEGEVETTAGGTYAFHTSTDDGARLWVDGRQLVDRWSDQAESEGSGTIELEAGRRYAIRFEYYEKGTIAAARLRWTPPGGNKEIIPPSRLSHLAGSADGAARNEATGLWLRGGSFLAGAIAAADHKWVEIACADSKPIRIPKLYIASVQLQPVDRGVREAMTSREPGCLLRDGTYLDASLAAIDKDGKVKASSILFGLKYFNRGEVQFIKLNQPGKADASFEVHTKSGSRLRVDSMVLDGEGGLLQDNSRFRIKLDPGDVSAVSGRVGA